MAGYLFQFIGVVMGIGFIGRAVMGFMDGNPDLHPSGYLALAWLMVFFTIIGRIILNMRSDVSEKDTYVALNAPRTAQQTRVPRQWTGRFVGWIFFGVGSTFAWLALSWLPGKPIYGRTLVLGVIFTVLGGIILILTYRALYKAKGDTKEQTRLEAKPMAMLGLIIAGLVLFAFFALGVLVIIANPDNWAAALIFFAIPAIGIAIFLLVRRNKKRNYETDQ